MDFEGLSTADLNEAETLPSWAPKNWPLDELDARDSGMDLGM